MATVTGDSIKHSSAEVKKFAQVRDPLSILDRDCYNALKYCKSIHPAIMAPAKNICLLIGPFIQCVDDGEMLANKILRQALNDFEEGLESADMRLSYYNYFHSIRNSLPEILDYTLEISNGNQYSTTVDILAQTMHKAVKSHPHPVFCTYTPIDAHLSKHELSLIMLSRVFNRGQMINLGIPGCGFNYVDDLKSRRNPDEEEV